MEEEILKIKKWPAVSPEGYSGEDIPEFKDVKEIIRLLSHSTLEGYLEYMEEREDDPDGDDFVEELIKKIIIVNTSKFLSRSSIALYRKSLFNKWKTKNEKICFDFERQLSKFSRDFFSDLWYASCYLIDFIDCMEIVEHDYYHDYRMQACVMGMTLGVATSGEKGTNSEEKYVLTVAKSFKDEKTNQKKSKTIYRTTDTQWIRMICSCVSMAIFDDSLDWKQDKNEYWSLSDTYKRYYFHKIMVHYLRSKISARRWLKNYETAESITTFMMFAMGLIKDKQGNMDDKYMKTIDDRKEAYNKMKCDPPKEEYRSNFYDNIWSIEPDNATETTVE